MLAFYQMRFLKQIINEFESKVNKLAGLFNMSIPYQ